jgi:4-aminobutyrate aminotransferase-like enzyme
VAEAGRNPIDTSLWHPFADMASVRDRDFDFERGTHVWAGDHEGRRYLDVNTSSPLLGATEEHFALGADASVHGVDALRPRRPAKPVTA